MAKAKRIKGIDCDDNALAGIGLVLQTRFEEMYGFHRAALDFSDPAGVHSMRVASRRLRSVLRDFRPYLPQPGITDVVKKTKNIAGVLGKVRDQDVAIIALEEIEKQAPAEVSVALKKLIDERKELRNESRKKLKTVLVTKQMKQTKSEFMSRIEEATALQKPRGQAERRPTFSTMATAVILDRLKELEELSDSLYKPFDVEPLHEMRIAAKRLRYALELFQECWGRSLQTYAKSVARMQTALGEVHDCDVWIESLGKAIDKAREKKQDDHVSALIWLLSHFVKVRTKHLLQAYALWRKWEVNDLSDRVRQAVQ